FVFFCDERDDLSVLSFFPTRRSSDLGIYFARISHRNRRNILPSLPRDPVRNAGLIAAQWSDAYIKLSRMSRRNCVNSFPFSFSRSEEHTSELQSRENLVCRLLLDKKK